MKPLHTLDPRAIAEALPLLEAIGALIVTPLANGEVELRPGPLLLKRFEGLTLDDVASTTPDSEIPTS